MKFREGVSILIIEDDPGHARLLEIAIRRLGIGNPLVKIGRGDDAMRYLGLNGHVPAEQPAEPPLLLLDLNLPGNSGFEVLKALRDQEARRHPVIIMTSSDDLCDRRRGKEFGCDDYLLKPPEDDELVAALSRLGLVVT